jgi:hypothetical protein
MKSLLVTIAGIVLFCLIARETVGVFGSAIDKLTHTVGGK